MATLAGRTADITGRLVAGSVYSIVLDTPPDGFVVSGAVAHYARVVGTVTGDVNGEWTKTVLRPDTLTPSGASLLIVGPFGMRKRVAVATNTVVTWDGVVRASVSYATITGCVMSLQYRRLDNTDITGGRIAVWLDVPQGRQAFLWDGTFVNPEPQYFETGAGGSGSINLVRTSAYGMPPNPFYMARLPDGALIRFQTPSAATGGILSTVYQPVYHGRGAVV